MRDSPGSSLAAKDKKGGKVGLTGVGGRCPEPSVRSRTYLIGKGTVSILGAVKGLLSEGPLVRAALERARPSAVGLHIGPQELRGLKSVVHGRTKSTYLSSYEKVYALKLSRFGEVQVPPPSLVEALRWVEENDARAVAMDLSDADYDRLYTDNVSGLTLVRQSLRLKSINRRMFRSASPELFCLEWDSVVNGPKGFRRLERHREAHFARRVLDLTKRFDPFFCVFELERMEGITSVLEGLLGQRQS